MRARMCLLLLSLPYILHWILLLLSDMECDFLFRFRNESERVNHIYSYRKKQNSQQLNYCDRMTDIRRDMLAQCQCMCIVCTYRQQTHTLGGQSLRLNKNKFWMTDLWIYFLALKSIENNFRMISICWAITVILFLHPKIIFICVQILLMYAMYGNHEACYQEKMFSKIRIMVDLRSAPYLFRLSLSSNLKFSILTDASKPSLGYSSKSTLLTAIKITQQSIVRLTNPTRTSESVIITH